MRSVSLTRPARIAFVDAYASIEGSGMALCDLIRHLDREQFEPIALLPTKGPLVEALSELDCPTEILPPAPPLNRFGHRLVEAGPATKLHAVLSLHRYAGQVAAWLRAHEVELLHCNQTRAAVLAGPGGRRAGIPVVWNVRIKEILPPSIVRVAEWCADRIIPLTEDCFDAQPRRHRLMRRATVIPNAVDTRRFAPSVDGGRVRDELDIPRDAPVVLTVGVLVPRKGFDVLIRAWPSVVRVHPSARLLIAGAAPAGDTHDYETALQALVKEFDLGSSVALLGRRDDVPELLAACQVFALPSRHEGQPAAVLEAMASARPAVVTPAASVGVTHGVTGLIVPEDDHEALAAALVALLGDPQRARRMGEAARAVIEQRHDLCMMVRQYEAVYRSLLGEGGRQG